MTFWIDAQLPPRLARWLEATFDVKAFSLYDLGLRDAQDIEIFENARQNGARAIIVTKDRDFVDLVLRLGTPPQILWLACGNISNRALQTLFVSTFSIAVELLEAGEAVVEIGS